MTNPASETAQARAVDTALGPRRALRVIVNANASGVERRVPHDRLAQALRRRGADAEFIETGSLEELATVWGERDGRRLVLVGGDGTLHAIPYLDGPAREVALIPAGSANNCARSLGIPLEVEAAAKLAVEGEARPVDLIEVRGEDVHRFVMESVSVGFLAQARVRYRSRRRNSADLLAGLRAGAAALAGFHPLAARIHSGDGTELLELSQLFVANLPLYEFGLRIAPGADPSDSTLDVIGIEAHNRRAVLRMVVGLRRGRPGHLRVHSWRAPALTLSTNGASPIVADSTDIGNGPVDLRALPGALHLVRP